LSKKAARPSIEKSADAGQRVAIREHRSVRDPYLHRPIDKKVTFNTRGEEEVGGNLSREGEGAKVPCNQLSELNGIRGPQ